MVRKLVSGTGALALGLGLLVATGGGAASATPTPVQFTGAVHCSAVGLLKFSPGLTNNGTAPAVVTLRAKLSGCTGTGASQSGVTLISGKLLATSTTPMTDACGAVLGGATLPDFTGTVTWKASGGLAMSSAVSVSDGAVFYNSGADTLTTYVAPTVSTGSFAAETMSFSDLVSNKNAIKLSASCGARGLGSLQFGKQSGSVVGSVDIGA
jgi:hypothetical protein